MAEELMRASRVCRATPVLHDTSHARYNSGDACITRITDLAQIAKHRACVNK